MKDGEGEEDESPKSVKRKLADAAGDIMSVGKKYKSTKDTSTSTADTETEDAAAGNDERLIQFKLQSNLSIKATQGTSKKCHL